ncbi:hypothetical protein HI914_05289 [Erysiphe necator]|nr:hypothetical protein HI914_05289 [Erysiphe necator]
MLLQTCVLIFGFLLSSALGSKPRQAVQYPISMLNAFCGNTYYSEEDLNMAAFKACVKYEKLISCKDRGSCFPKIMQGPKVTTYEGDLFTIESGFPLLKWPLGQKSWRHRVNNHVIVNYVPDTKKCIVIGAIMAAKNGGARKHLKCIDNHNNEN